MKRLSLFLSLLLTSLILIPSLGFANPCPKDWHHERTSILHDSPKKRLFGGKSSGGRVCLEFRKPLRAPRSGGGTKTVCPDGYNNERTGIFHSSPKQRLLKSNNTQDGRTCIVVIKPGSSPAGKPWVPHTSSKPQMAYMRGAQITVTKGIYVRYRATDPSQGVCASRCQSDALCVATNYTDSSKSCTILGQYNWHKGDALKSGFEYGAQVKPASGWLSFKRNNQFKGKVDYRPMFRVSQSSCINRTFYPTDGSTNKGPTPHHTTHNIVLKCLYDTHCTYAQYNAQGYGGKPEETFHQKSPSTSDLAGGTCTKYIISRPVKYKTSGRG